MASAKLLFSCSLDERCSCARNDLLQERGVDAERRYALQDGKSTRALIWPSKVICKGMFSFASKSSMPFLVFYMDYNKLFNESLCYFLIVMK
jgi:hypothetical protein